MTADEIALRDQGVLLGRGAATLDFGIAYTHSEETPLPGTRVEQRALGLNAALRYGVLERAWHKHSGEEQQGPDKTTTSFWVLLHATSRQGRSFSPCELRLQRKI